MGAAGMAVRRGRPAAEIGPPSTLAAAPSNAVVPPERLLAVAGLGW
jgi:hypothetical protein